MGERERRGSLQVKAISLCTKKQVVRCEDPDLWEAGQTLPFVGTISVTPSKQLSHKGANVFGQDLHVLGKSVSMASSRICVPAWLVQTTHVPEEASG